MAALRAASGCGARETVNSAAVSYLAIQTRCRYWDMSMEIGREIVIRRQELRCTFSPYRAVNTLHLGYKIHTVYLCALCGSQNKQRLFPYTTLTDWFL